MHPARSSASVSRRVWAQKPSWPALCICHLAISDDFCALKCGRNATPVLLRSLLILSSLASRALAGESRHQQLRAEQPAQTAVCAERSRDCALQRRGRRARECTYVACVRFMETSRQQDEQRRRYYIGELRAQACRRWWCAAHCCRSSRGLLLLRERCRSPKFNHATQHVLERQEPVQPIGKDGHPWAWPQLCPQAPRFRC